MSGTRFVNVVPLPKIKALIMNHQNIKKEVISDEEEETTINCRICSKSFVSPMALRNHAMMEHFEAFASGDPSAWTEPSGSEKQKSNKSSRHRLQRVDSQAVQIKAEQIVSSMKPGSLTSLVSEDVSYIIIKSEDDLEADRKRKLAKVDGGKRRETAAKRQKEPTPITGPFECVQDGFCHRIFFSCCEYSTHYRDEHTRRRKGLRCQVCEKPLSSDGDSQFPYNCDVCGAGFNTNKELSSHTSAAHVKLKPFQCQVCHKRFTQQGGVQQHMRAHTGDRPFSCTFCPKAFTQKSGLDQHLRIHTKVKPYRCVICSKAFCQSIHLKQHMRTHTNVSPFQCGICAKRFKQSSHLNYHLKNHNPANMTDEQKQKYAELIGMMSGDSVEVEVEHVEVPDEQLVEAEAQHEQIVEQLKQQIEEQIEEHIEGEIEEQHEEQIEEQHEEQIEEQLEEQIEEQHEEQIEEQIEEQLEEQIEEQLEEHLEEEQEVAEQSVEVWDGEDTYVLTDGQEWNVQLVDC